MKPLRDIAVRHVHQWIQNLVARGVEAWVARQRDLRLLQFGANDGVMADPVHDIVKKPHVHSVLVEPVPHVFDRLEATYRLYPQVRCLKLAVVPDEETTSVDFFFLKPREGFEFDDLYSGWSSTRREHLEKFRQYVRNFDELLCCEQVPSVTVNRLFQMSGWPTLDLLQIDVEGLDVEIVGSIYFTTWRPRLIRFEHMHSHREPLYKLLHRLRGLGYHTFSSGFDTTCVQEADLRDFRWLWWIGKLHPAWLWPPR